MPQKALISTTLKKFALLKENQSRKQLVKLRDTVEEGGTFNKFIEKTNLYINLAKQREIAESILNCLKLKKKTHSKQLAEWHLIYTLDQLIKHTILNE